MKIATATLFLGLSVFLRSFELISSQVDRAKKTTLRDLFPESNGIHFPDVEELGHKSVESLSNFTILDNQQMVKRATTYLKRGYVIFGWLKGDDDIEPLDLLFGKQNLFAVFNTKNQQWRSLTSNELEKLGSNRSLTLVRAHDKAHAVVHNQYRRYRNQPNPQLHAQVHPEAHHAASETAFHTTKIYEKAERKIYKNFAVIPEFDARSVKQVYDRAYNEAYQRHVEGTSGGH